MNASELDKMLAKENWVSLSDAYGSADELPSLLRSLMESDSHLRKQAYEDLVSRIVHQGVSRFEASAHAVPYLVSMASLPDMPERPRLLDLLANIAIGDMSSWLDGSLAQLRTTVAREAALSREELQLELETWVLSAETDELRKRRADNVRSVDVEFLRDARKWDLQAYDAVKESIPEYVQLLRSSDPDVCMWAAYVLGWFPEERSAITSELLERAKSEGDERIVTTICMAIGLLGDPGLSRRFLLEKLRSPSRGERWGSAVALALIDPDPAAIVVEELAACTVHRPEFNYDGPYGDSLSWFARILIQQGDSGAWELRPGPVIFPGLRV
jgi:hypothetical protein